ncbi:hypothetical protein O181_019580 [Austropuccinia psidii MF-1]|uniref:Uncharacterized protein n=1 Tax=Austropuccinia psidii MF-1 TaxID=1389203 RepID=A0A9Q3CC33_9BASI|nr:hypothetical protein [Austropuccinia psidii MF-1]
MTRGGVHLKACASPTVCGCEIHKWEPVIVFPNLGTGVNPPFAYDPNHSSSQYLPYHNLEYTSICSVLRKSFPTRCIKGIHLRNLTSWLSMIACYILLQHFISPAAYMYANGVGNKMLADIQIRMV